jgi:feruloyl esterase
MKPNRFLAVSAAVAGLTCGSAQAAVGCESMASVYLPDTVVTLAQVVPAGTFQPPSGGAQQNLPEFCRIAGRIQNHATSRIMFEVWLPTQVANQRLVQVGNGGFAGNIQFGAMATRLREGYATASTDDGTSAAPGVPPAERLTFLGDFERLYDFKGRAVTLTAVNAKTLFRSFYGNTPAYSYFTGCSSGGLEALAVAQRIGEEFDGVTAGSPANNSAGLFTQAIWTYKYYQKISTKLQLVHDAVLAACDSIGDGVKDGVIGDPQRCRFDPRQLRCEGPDSPDCLTAEQVDAVRKIYEGPVNPRNGRKTGEQYAPGMPRGSELGWSGSQGQAGGASQPWYGMVLHNTLTLDFTTFDFDTDVDRALKLTLPYGAQVTNPDLSALRNHGGKLMLWAGWNDPLWSEQNIVDYYENVVVATGEDYGHGHRHWDPKPVGSPLERTRRFARLFMAPGVGHCGGGDGPNVFDTFAPLVQWVESGTAPDRIIATKFVNDQPAQGIALTRPLCAYPDVARWTGAGDPNSAVNFACTRPRHDLGEHDHGDRD